MKTVQFHIDLRTPPWCLCVHSRHERSSTLELSFLLRIWRNEFLEFLLMRLFCPVLRNNDSMLSTDYWV
jgi:hypothetical protein